MSQDHWEHIYRTGDPTQVSWQQPEPRLSLDLIRRAAPDLGSAIIDVGGGASTLVDALLDAGYGNLTVLDLAPSALAIPQERLGPRAAGSPGSPAACWTRPCRPGGGDDPASRGGMYGRVELRLHLGVLRYRLLLRDRSLHLRMSPEKA